MKGPSDVEQALTEVETQLDAGVPLRSLIKPPPKSSASHQKIKAIAVHSSPSISLLQRIALKDDSEGARARKLPSLDPSQLRPTTLHERLMNERQQIGRRAIGLVKPAPVQSEGRPSRKGAESSAQRRAGKRLVDQRKRQPDVCRAFALSRDAASAFFDADVDGNTRLSFEEFASAVPPEHRRNMDDAKLRALFDSADTDGSGEISMDEFFLWTLGIVESQTGSGVEAIFRKCAAARLRKRRVRASLCIIPATCSTPGIHSYVLRLNQRCLRRYDTDHCGKLDASEFALACEDLGFSSISHDLFLELDPDGSGTVSADELMGAIRQRGASREAKRFLYGLSMSEMAVELVGWTSWELPTTSTTAVRDYFRTMLREHQPPAKPSDLHRLLTRGKRGFMSVEQFQAAMYRIGLSSKFEHMWLVEALFRELDCDRSGRLGERDFVEWMNDSSGIAEKARNLTLTKPVRHDVSWTPDLLREALQSALLDADIAPLHLLRAWDSDQEGRLERKEMVTNLKRTVDDPELWEAQLRDVALQTFLNVSGGDSCIDVVEFQTWLNIGWLSLKQNRKSGERHP